MPMMNVDVEVDLSDFKDYDIIEEFLDRNLTRKLKLSDFPDDVLINFITENGYKVLPKDVSIDTLYADFHILSTENFIKQLKTFFIKTIYR